MLALRELQEAFADAILGRSVEPFAPRVRSDRLPAAARLRVYQNNVFVSLTEALAAVYPVLERLVGEAFFFQLARRFIQVHPPQSGNLQDFGGALSRYLRTLREAFGLPYLADVAQLEWAYHEVFHAADAGSVDLERLAKVPQAAQPRLRFRLHPAARLLASPYPIFAIWKANQGEDEPQREIDLDTAADYLLVARRDLDRVIERLSAGEFAVLSEMANAATLEQACEAAVAADPQIDLAAAVRRFVADRTIVGFHLF